MGIDIAQDVINHKYQSADQRLWRHVVLNAFDDARLYQSDRKSSIYKMEAHEWIAEDSKEQGTVEGFPKLEGRNMTMVIAPIKQQN